MHSFSIFILAIATNLDNLCIGMAYGCQGRLIGTKINACIALISGLVSFALCWASSFLAVEIQETANLIGALLLIGMGVYTLFSTHNKQEAASIGRTSAVALGLTLAVNCIPAALGEMCIRDSLCGDRDPNGLCGGKPQADRLWPV